MSDAVKPDDVAPSLGLRGIWAQVGNLGAVALIGLLLLRGFDAGVEVLREERRLCREAIEQMDRGLEGNRAAISALTGEIRAWRIERRESKGK